MHDSFGIASDISQPACPLINLTAERNDEQIPGDFSECELYQTYGTTKAFMNKFIPF